MKNSQIFRILLILVLSGTISCSTSKNNEDNMNQKMTIYQVLPRLFGNKCLNPVFNGSMKENGCGKMADFTDEILQNIRDMGFSHIWYTGIIEHATQTSYAEYGIRDNHPAIVKGKAGSPYSIKDYYDVSPDLAIHVPERMSEFEALIARTHQAGLKAIIDFVPNHVAREYFSDAKPENTVDLGASDHSDLAFSPQNNFYYIPNEKFAPDFNLPDEKGQLYEEFPAKATGNDSFTAYPKHDDWYETVKLNYGVDYGNNREKHFDPIPDTWLKMRDILLFWASKNVDGFRCDMAEMVPVEFWAWAIPQVKKQSPQVIFIAEIYNPAEYRNYLSIGKFDYLYDKVGLYDTLRDVICGRKPATAITACWQAVDDIQSQMLNFLENHDEQRIASDFFAGNPLKARPALAVSAWMGTSPFMVYFGQELGERGMENEGFSGADGRTTIFDYWSVPSFRYPLTDEQKSLREYYIRVLKSCRETKAIRSGKFFDLMYVNPELQRQYAFLRYAENELLLIVANFDEKDVNLDIFIPEAVFECFGIKGKKAFTHTVAVSGYDAVVVRL